MCIKKIQFTCIKKNL